MHAHTGADTFAAGCWTSTDRISLSYPPDQVQRDLAAWRRRIDEHCFWDQGQSKMTQAQALESIVFADTFGGDEFIFHAARSAQILVVARDSSDIFLAGCDLWSMLSWVQTSDVLYPPHEDNTFEALASERSDLSRSAD